jgi:hypothetical protein
LGKWEAEPERGNAFPVQVFLALSHVAVSPMS